MPTGFDGDYVLGGLLTIGSSWHNYWGLVDEVKIYRSALSREAVEGEFEQCKDAFQIVESQEVVAAKERAQSNTKFGRRQHRVAGTPIRSGTQFMPRDRCLDRCAGSFPQLCSLANRAELPGGK